MPVRCGCCIKIDHGHSLIKFIKILDNKDQKRTPEAIPSILSDALAVSFDNHIGHDYIEDAQNRFEWYHTKEKRYKFDLGGKSVQLYDLNISL